MPLLYLRAFVAYERVEPTYYGILQRIFIVSVSLVMLNYGY